jgi:hypothetical protein
MSGFEILDLVIRILAVVLPLVNAFSRKGKGQIQEAMFWMLVAIFMAIISKKI